MRILIAAFFALFATLSAAAPLSTAQQTALKAAAVADPVANAYVQSGDDVALAAWFNAPGACVVWKSSVPVGDIYENTSSTGTNWEWTTYISSTTTQERDAWREMTRTGSIKSSLQQVRDGWAKIFSGTGAAVVAQRAHLASISQRTGSRAESTLATGLCTAASPSTMGFEGVLTYIDASNIRTLP